MGYLWLTDKLVILSLCPILLKTTVSISLWSFSLCQNCRRSLLLPSKRMSFPLSVSNMFHDLLSFHNQCSLSTNSNFLQLYNIALYFAFIERIVPKVRIVGVRYAFQNNACHAEIGVLFKIRNKVRKSSSATDVNFEAAVQYPGNWRQR